MSTEKQYIARISYGKDSLKMLEVIKSRGLPLDRITTTDVWATDTISANLPPMDEFTARMDQRIWDMYHIEVEHLCALNPDGTKKTYEQMFYHIPKRKNSQSVQVERERERERPGTEPQFTTYSCRERERENKFAQGSITGFPILGHPWCQSELKRRAYRVQGSITGFPPNTGYNWCQKLKIVTDSNQGIPHGKRGHMVPETQNPGTDPRDSRPRSPHGAENSRSTGSEHPFYPSPPRRANRNIVEYLGIAADEPARFGQLNARKRAPLVEFGIDEDLCGLYCQYNDMLSPTYETSCRDGCWFCHNQGVAQLRHLRKNHPDHWALLMKWDLDSPVTFKADGHTVHDFDRRFQLEDEGIIYPDEYFRWSMLEEELNLRWF